MYELTTESSFDAAHFLTDYYGKCENLHGHRWRVEAGIAASSLQESGTNKDMVMDFGVFKKALREVCKRFDHMFLVEEGSLAPQTLECLEGEGFTLMMLPFRTTAENLACCICGILVDEYSLPVSYVEVDETPNNRAIYRP